MMQIWTGLLLRMENEAQLAAIIGHEIGHYLQRHSVERLRDARTRSAFGQFIGLFGVAGSVAQLAVIASMFSYSREQETEADRIGLVLLRSAGYDPREAARVWDNLLLEIRARKDQDTWNIPMFATHPAPEDRRSTLRQLAEASGGGETGADAWQKAIASFRHEWILEEVKRRQPEESLALLNRLIGRLDERAEYLFARGEVYRMRAGTGDTDAAIADYRAAIAAGREPVETHRALGMIYRAGGQPKEARASFERYLSVAPDAPDAAFIKAYLAELGS
jgi:predicted Zn-dependent protease